LGGRAGVETWLDLPPTPRQSLAAATVTALVLLGFAAIAPFASVQLAQLNAFFPTLDAFVFVTDLITAALLFAQFSVSRSRALLALASGYLFTAFIVVPHALTFAGALSPTGLLGANIQTGSWLFIFWHVGFSLSLFGYSVLRHDRFAAPPAAEPSDPRPAIWATIIGVFLLVCFLTCLSTAGATLLPAIILDNVRISPIVIYPIWLTILITAAGLAVLWMGRQTLLDRWLMVVAVVGIFELVFSGLLPTIRFSAGFYAGRVLSLVAASIVLIVLLAEATRLYVHLARSNTMLEQERHNKLLSLEAVAGSIAHEARQPMSGVVLFGEAALQYLARKPAEVEKARSAVQQMMAASQQAGQTLENIQTLFGEKAPSYKLVDLNDLARAVLENCEPDLRGQGIETKVKLQPNLPMVMGHKGQLQEVVLNLINNAVEAMKSSDAKRAVEVRTKVADTGKVVLCVADTGPGITADQAVSIFDAFVTTKPKGMGLGLAICRMIVERHSGRLSVSTAEAHGAVFQVELPCVPT
jgi:signal transduction histidine kinase